MSALSQHNFTESVVDGIKHSKVKANRICFEITETTAIGNLDNALSFITALKAIRFRFPLDDFGSGHSSYAYLKHLRVDYLKIDGVFIQDMLEDPVNLAIVKSINKIGHKMNLLTIAEFVENDELIHKLEKVGIDYVQGFGVEKPKPLEQLKKQLNHLTPLFA